MLWDSLFEAAIRLSVPLLLVALGELVAQRSGVINIGLEGMMSFGAFFGWLVLVATGSPAQAILCAVLAGALVASLMALVSIKGGANQILTGFALTVMIPGITAFLYQQSLVGFSVATPLPVYAIPVLSDIPLIGRALFAQNIFYYLAIALAVIFWILLNRTRFGLAVAACGHDPEVAVSKGVGVETVRTISTLIAGAMAGLAGAALTVGALGSFSAGAVGGRGFIAIAIVILSRWTVGGAVLAALAIGISDALRLRIGSQLHIPVSIVAMIPWLVVLALLVAGSRKSRMPKAIGRNRGAATAAS